MKVWLVQMEVKLNDREANLQKILDYVDKGLQNGANLIAFSELALSGYMCKARFFEVAESIPGPSTDKVASMIRGRNTYVTFGMPESQDGSLYISAPLIGPLGIVGVCRKLHLATLALSPTTGLTYDEGIYFKPGEHIATFDTEFGKIGIQICWDMFYPEVARAQALEGAWLIVHPIAVPVRIAGKQRSPYSAVRALENLVHWCDINQVGEQAGVQFGGGSCVIDAVLGVRKEASAGKDAKEEVIECELESGPVFQRRCAFPILRGVRPEIVEKLFKIARRVQHGE